MKKAEEYLNDLQPIDFNPKFLSAAIKRIIRLAQEDAIRETVKECAENVLLSIDDIVEKSNGQSYLVVDGNHYSETFINIDKQSILSVADKLIKEL